MRDEAMLESIELGVLITVSGGMSTGELACRGTGALLGGVGGLAANLTGFGAAGAGAAIASGTASVVGGVVNAAGARSHGEASFDTVMGLYGALPLAGAPGTAYTGGKLGWKAGGALCGYGWNSR